MAIGVRVGIAVGASIGPAIGVSADPLGSGGDFIVGAGDSNTFGIGSGDAADPGFHVGTPNPAILYGRHCANGTGPPPVFTDFPSANALGPLQLYAASGTQSMGLEMSLGPTVLAGGLSSPAIGVMGVSGSTLGNEWLPTSTYPAPGAGNLFSLFVAQMKALSGGRTIRFSYWNLGTNDATSVPLSTAFQANMGALATALRETSAFGPNHVMVWVKTNAATDAGTHPGLAAVRAAQVAYAAGDPLFVLIDSDDLALLGDGLHFVTDAYLTLGQRVGIAGLIKLGIARRAALATPDVMMFGPAAKGSGNLSIIAPGDVQNGDLLMLGIATGVANTAIATPAGWTRVGVTAQSVFGGSSFCQMALFTKAATTAEINANGGHIAPAAYVAADTENIGQMWVIRGPNANPTVDVAQNTTPNSFTTGPQAITGVTTAAAHELVLALFGGFCGQAGSNTLTNGTLAGVAPVFDAPHLLPDANFQLLTLAKGALAAAGASGSWSVTSSNNVLGNAIVIGVKP